ncbi:MAG: hypothetical protein QXO29_01955, partial [Nitrososphaerota archaeon]
MNEKIVIWLLRTITIIVIITPFTFYYFTSGSLLNFIMPNLNLPHGLPSFDFSSIRIVSIDYLSTNGEYILNIKLLNNGNTRIGLNKLNVKIINPSSNINGEIILQTPFILEPGKEENVQFLFSLEKGSIEDFIMLLTQGYPINLSGNVTLVLNLIEIPLDFSINNFSF